MFALNECFLCVVSVDEARMKNKFLPSSFNIYSCISSSSLHVTDENAWKDNKREASS